MYEPKGWIKLHRKIMDKAIWQESTPEQKVILITLLMMANHKEKEWEWNGKSYKTIPGQFVTSLKNISEKAGKGISIQNVRTALNKFEKHGFLTNKSTNKNRLITIVNWRQYQREGDEPNNEDNKATNKHLTTEEELTNKPKTGLKPVNNSDTSEKTEKVPLEKGQKSTSEPTSDLSDIQQVSEDMLTEELTSDQQAPNKHLTTNKNDKNVKNVRIDDSTLDDFISTYKVITSTVMNPKQSSIDHINNFISGGGDLKQVLKELRQSDYLIAAGDINWLCANLENLVKGKYRNRDNKSRARTGFHNFEGQGDSLTIQELDEIAERKMAYRAKGVGEDNG